LENKLSEFRTQPAASANMLQQAHQGRRNNNNNPYFQQQHQQHSRKSSCQNLFHQGTTAIIHFTSLSNYKAVRDTIQCFAVLPSRDPFSMPRVVVVPKPAGPRRFLTALHTAWNNAVVEPHFSAIATSPSSPMPPMISMLVQREIAAATINSPENRISPGGENISPGGGRSNRRPTSGIFSPPTVDNYFSSQHPRRRSTNNTLTNEIDYLTAKQTPPTAENVPHVEEIQAVDIAPMEPVKVTTPPIAIQQQQDHVVTPQFDEPSEPSEPSQDSTPTAEPVLKKKVGRTMSNFKLHKKKRKEKGKPFADVVSPPINVLIVEDNIINQAILSAWMKKHKIKFSVASNGLEAVNKWKIGGFHLILVSISNKSWGVS
jgi:osomolarity two-component system response regulator SSK1